MFRRKRSPRVPTATARLSHLFHGIAIEPGEDACQAARNLANERFLSDEAPHLPLDGCTTGASCRCVYRHYADRRTEVRREADLGLPPRMVRNENRNGAGRRITDC
jgi:hypothetical protein